MLGKAKVEGRFLRVHANGVAEAASFGSFRAGIGGDFSIGTTLQPVDPGMSLHGAELHASTNGAPSSAILRPVLSASAGITHVEGQKGLDAVEVLFAGRDAGQREAAGMVRVALEAEHARRHGEAGPDQLAHART